MPTAEKQTRVVSAVGAIYREVVEGLDGEKRLVTRTATRGQEVELDPREEARLDGLGALAAPGATAADVRAQVLATREQFEAAYGRAVNPYDYNQSLAVPAPSVSPPPGGAPPRGDLVTGDTGDPTPEATVTAIPPVAGDGDLDGLSRDELNEVAAAKGVEDPEGLSNKQAVIDAIQDR